MIRVIRFPTAVRRDPAVDAWLQSRTGAFRLIRTAYADMKAHLADRHTAMGTTTA